MYFQVKIVSYNFLRIHWRISAIIKTSKKVYKVILIDMWKYVFWYIKVCIFWEFIQCTIHWDKTQMSKKFPSDKSSSTKNVLIFLLKAPKLITVLLLICDSYVSWSTSFVYLKLCVVFSIFESVSFLLKFIFLFNKMYGLVKLVKLLWNFCKTS